MTIKEDRVADALQFIKTKFKKGKEEISLLI